MALGKKDMKRLPPSLQNPLHLFSPNFALNSFARGGLRKKDMSGAPRQGIVEALHSASSPKPKGLTPSAMGDGLSTQRDSNNARLLCSRGKPGSPLQIRGCTAHPRAAAGHQQAAVLCTTERAPGKGRQPPAKRCRTPQGEDQPWPCQFGQTSAAASVGHELTMASPAALRALTSLSLSSCLSPPSASCSTGVPVSVAAVPPTCPSCFLGLWLRRMQAVAAHSVPRTERGTPS